MQSLTATIFGAAVSLVTLLMGATYAQRPFREYPGVEHENFPIPPDYQEKTEWAFARLMYPPTRGNNYWQGIDWTQGRSNWTIDYPASDRKSTRLNSSHL